MTTFRIHDRAGWSKPEAWTCDEMLREEILAAMEAEFGPLVFPIPSGPVWHQSLGSDAEMHR